MIIFTMSILDDISFYNKELYECLYECSELIIKYQESPKFIEYKNLFIFGVFNFPEYNKIYISSIKIIFYTIIIVAYYVDIMTKK